MSEIDQHPPFRDELFRLLTSSLNREIQQQIGAKVFNPLPDSNIGARGCMGARVQPNSPTDNVDDIRWQVFDAFAYAVGDVLLGTNPVSSTPESVAVVDWSGFFQQLGVIDAQGQPTEHFGDPSWVFQQYCRRKNDARTDIEIQSEAANQIEAVRSRGVFIADEVDHNITKVVSGIANTALAPEAGAIEAVRILRQTDVHTP